MDWITSPWKKVVRALDLFNPRVKIIQKITSKAKIHKSNNYTPYKKCVTRIYQSSLDGNDEVECYDLHRDEIKKFHLQGFKCDSHNNETTLITW